MIKIFFYKLFAKKCEVCKKPAHKEFTGKFFCWRHFKEGQKRDCLVPLSYSIPIQHFAWEIDPPPNKKTKEV